MMIKVLEDAIANRNINEIDRLHVFSLGVFQNIVCMLQRLSWYDPNIRLKMTQIDAKQS